MPIFDAMVIWGADYGEFSRSMGVVCRAIPREKAEGLFSILNSYFARYGFDGVYQRMNGRTVSQIFAQYQADDIKPIASGEVDGVRYGLYEGSRPDATKAEGPPGEKESERS